MFPLFFKLLTIRIDEYVTFTFSHHNIIIPFIIVNKFIGTYGSLHKLNDGDVNRIYLRPQNNWPEILLRLLININRYFSNLYL